MLKSKLYLTLALVILVAIAAGGGTLALFAASPAEPLDTTFLTAATLNITSERDDGDRVPGPMFYVTGEQGATPAGLEGIYPTEVWAPGDSQTRTLTVYNRSGDGSTLDAWLDSVEASLQPGSYAPMADKMWVEIFTPNIGNDNKVAEGWLSTFLSGPVELKYPDGTKPACLLDSNRHMKFKVTFDQSAGNDLQDKSLVVSFTVNAVQMRNNP